MSLEAERKTPLKSEMKTGQHLAIISGIKMYIDSNKEPIIRNEEMGIVITFTNGKNEHHEQIYWIGKGNDGNEKYFTKMCIDAGIDMSVTPIAKKDAIGKRLFIAIREVYTLVNGEVKTDITGADIIEYFIFHTSVCDDPDKMPFIAGDPNKNMGQAMGEFIAYKNEGQNGYDVNAIESNKNTLEVEEITDADVVELERTILPEPVIIPFGNTPDVYNGSGTPKDIIKEEYKLDIKPSLINIPAELPKFGGEEEIATNF